MSIKACMIMIKIYIICIFLHSHIGIISLFLKNIGKYWPPDLNAVSEFGPFRVTKKSFTEGKDFTIVDLCCNKEGQNEVHM